MLLLRLILTYRIHISHKLFNNPFVLFFKSIVLLSSTLADGWYNDKYYFTFEVEIWDIYLCLFSRIILTTQHLWDPEICTHQLSKFKLKSWNVKALRKIIIHLRINSKSLNKATECLFVKIHVWRVRDTLKIFHLLNLWYFMSVFGDLKYR